MAGRPRTEISKEWLQSKVDSGMNDKEIATSLSHQGTSVSAKTIQRRRIEFGVRTKRRRLGTDAPSSSSSSPLSGSGTFASVRMSESLSDSNLLRGHQQHSSHYHRHYSSHHHRALSFDEEDENPRKIRSPSQTRSTSPTSSLASSSSTPALITSSSSLSASSLIPYPAPRSSSSPDHSSNSSTGSIESPTNTNTVKAINHSTPMIIAHLPFSVAYPISNLSKSQSSPSLLSSHGFAPLHTNVPSSSSSSSQVWLDNAQGNSHILSPPYNRQSAPSEAVPSPSFQYHHPNNNNNSSVHHPHLQHHPHHPIMHPDSNTSSTSSSTTSTSSPSHDQSTSTSSSSPYTFTSNPRPLPSLQSLLNNNLHSNTSSPSLSSPEPRRSTTSSPSPLISSPIGSRLNINSLLSSNIESDLEPIDHMSSSGPIAWLSPVQKRKSSHDEIQNRSPVHNNITSSSILEDDEEKQRHNSNNNNMMDIMNGNNSTSHNISIDPSLDLTMDRETAECARQLQRISTSHSPVSTTQHQQQQLQQQQLQQQQLQQQMFARYPENYNVTGGGITQSCAPTSTQQQPPVYGGGRVSSIHSVLSMRN